MVDKRTEKAFTEAMLGIYREAREELGYNASRFRQMVVARGGVEAARALLRSSSVSDGYEMLWEHGRLDLSVEALVLRREWAELFTDEEREIARRRLDEFDYQPEETSPPAGNAGRTRPSPSKVLVAGRRYTRPELYELVAVPEDKRRGDWETGYHRDDQDRWYIFASVGAASRTGHDYRNEWRGNQLVWRGRTGSKLEHPSIRHMIDPETEVHVFTRSADRAPFTYQGMGEAVETKSTEPVTVVWRFPRTADDQGDRDPSELSPAGRYPEGAVQQVSVNAYERNRRAREECLDHWGRACTVCEMEFGARYGSLVEGYIHVHHLVPLGEVPGPRDVDPIEDLRPVCPNCHAVIHKTDPPLTIDEARELLEAQSSRG